MSPVLEAHLRMLSTLPVRTHHQPADKEAHRSPHYMTPTEATERKKRIKAMRKEGKTPKEIAEIEKVSKQTVYNHLRIRNDY